jgi:hypothetical protein
MNWMDEFLTDEEKNRTDKTDNILKKSITDKADNLKTSIPLTDKTDKSPNPPESQRDQSDKSLEARLVDRGFSIAIDRATGRALLLFKPADADIVRDVASVHQPFAIALTAAQREELAASLDYFESLEHREGAQR